MCCCYFCFSFKFSCRRRRHSLYTHCVSSVIHLKIKFSLQILFFPFFNVKIFYSDYLLMPIGAIRTHMFSLNHRKTKTKKTKIENPNNFICTGGGKKEKKFVQAFGFFLSSHYFLALLAKMLLLLLLSMLFQEEPTSQTQQKATINANWIVDNNIVII